MLSAIPRVEDRYVYEFEVVQHIVPDDRSNRRFTQSPDALSNFILVHPRVAEYYPWP
jgi:hypothetical protein